MASAFSDAEATSLAAKVRVRLVWPCAALLLVSTIDRTNVSFAAAQMNRSIGMNDAQYGLGAGIFFIGYILGQMPSIMILERIGFRRWIAGITLLWGLCATGMASIHSLSAFYGLRVLLGLAEAGLAPGIVLYLSRWSDDRGRAYLIAIPLAAIPLSVAIAGPLSGGLLQMPSPMGLDNWRWMFLAEGIPALVLAVVAYLYFPDTPAQARWLVNHERDWVASLAPPKHANKGRGDSSWRSLSEPRVWLCALLWFCLMAGNYGVIFWLPQILHALANLSPLEVGGIVALPWLANIAGILTASRRSDRKEERYLHIAAPSLVSAAAVLGAYWWGASVTGFVFLIILGASLGCSLGPFWAVPLRLLPPRSRSVGTVVINVVGGIAGLLIPGMFGAIRQASGSFAIPTILLAAIVGLGGGVALVARQVDRPSRIDIPDNTAR